MRTAAHIFRPVSACPLRSPICAHATVQSAAIKSDSGQQNICKTLPRFLLAFIRSPRRRRPFSRCSYLRVARPISAKYKCVIRRTRPISVEYKCIIKRTRAAIHEHVSAIALFALLRDHASRQQLDSIPISGRTGDILPRS